MTTPDDIAQRYLDFDPATFGEARGAALDTAEIALLDEDFHGIACRAPKTVTAGAAEIPVVMALRSTGHRAWQVPRDAHVQLLLGHLESRRLWVGRPFHDQKLDEYPPPEDELSPPEEPTGPSAQSILVDVQRLDAAAVAGHGPPPGELRVGLLMMDTASNLQSVTLEGTPNPVTRWPVQPVPGTRGVRSFVRLPAMAEPRTCPGLTIEVQPGGLVTGRVVVDAQPIHIFDRAFTLDEGDGVVQSVWATIPLTLLVVDSSGRAARRLDLAVPVLGSGLTSQGDRLEGGFVLEPSATWGALLEGTLVWVWLEGTLLGPWPLT